MPTIKMQNWNSSEYVTISIAPFPSSGGKRSCPLAQRANRLPFGQHLAPYSRYQRQNNPDFAKSQQPGMGTEEKG